MGENHMSDKLTEDFREDSWYKELCEEGKYIYLLIHKYHKYFSKQDKKYRCIVRAFRILVLLFSMINTIVLGMKTIISADGQVVTGLVLSALITFISAVSSYFNFEEYWMRNITIHIDLNILRDNFIFDAKIGRLVEKEELEKYRKTLEELQKKNIEYWKKSLKNIG